MLLLLWSWCPAVSLQHETVTERLFWHFYWLVSCLYLPPRSHSSTAANRFFCSLQSHTGCKIHLRCESQRNVWAIITLHICGSFFQSSWKFQQSWAVSNKIVFSPQMTPGRCHKVARSGLSSQLSYSANQKSTKTQDNLKTKETFMSQNKRHWRQLHWS